MGYYKPTLNKRFKVGDRVICRLHRFADSYGDGKAGIVTSTDCGIYPYDYTVKFDGDNCSTLGYQDKELEMENLLPKMIEEQQYDS